jgi:hypothetical protein
MNNILDTIKSADPFEQLYDAEFNHMFLSFCSLVCLLHGKKMNLANIFILLMKDIEIRDLYKMLTDTETDYDALSSFLQYDPSLYKSKYITNFLATSGINVTR